MLEAGKLHADNAAYVGDFPVAEVRYESLEEWITRVNANMINAWLGTYFSSPIELLSFQRTFRLFCLDLAMTRAYVLQKQGRFYGFNQAIVEILDELAKYQKEDQFDGFSLPPETLSCLQHLYVLASALVTWFDYFSDDWIEQRPRQLQ